jgi:hypothetical protein
MPIPKSGELRFPVLQVLADGVEHSSEEIMDRFQIQFNLTPADLSQKHKRGNSVRQNNIDLALANQQGAPRAYAPFTDPPYIEKIRVGVYRINERGKEILKRIPQKPLANGT